MRGVSLYKLRIAHQIHRDEHPQASESGAPMMTTIAKPDMLNEFIAE